MYKDDLTIIFGNEIELYKLLLSHSGIGINYQKEMDADKILDRGILRNGVGKRSVLLKGEREDCHQNSAIIWAHNPKRFNWEMGWALQKDDDAWFQHSWIYDNDKKIIIETTMRRKLYYGYALNGEEAREIIHNCCGHKMIKQLYRLD